METIDGAYHQYLLSDEWAIRRAFAINRAGGYCERCGLKPLWLEVHHRHYRTIGAERPEDMEVLCPLCHREADDERKKENALRHYDARLDGWAVKVYGEDWEDRFDWNDVSEEFDLWLDRRTD